VSSIHRVLEHRVRAVVALLVLTLTALVLVACGDGGGGGGGSASSGGGDATAVVSQTFASFGDIESGRADLDIALEGSSDSGSVKIAGPFQRGEDGTPEFDLAVDADLGAAGGTLGLVAADGRLVFEFGGTAYELPGGSGGAGIGDLGGLDPTAWIADPRLAGEEELDGVQTQHVAARVDGPALVEQLSKLLERLASQLGSTVPGLPKTLPSEVRSEIEQALESATVDIWTGKDDHLLRKLLVHLRIESQGQSGDVNLTLLLTDVNEPQQIAAPKDARPISELLGQLGALSGALGGSSGGSVPNIDEYSKCIQEAGNDLSKAQKCADLLTE
jgi:hypothetical protein